MIRRFLVLLRFEIRKVLIRKKAFLFLGALNVVPIMAGILAMLVYVKFKGWGLGNVQFQLLVDMVRKLFAGHIKLFAWISPFFLALVIGDSFSGEAGRGHLKTLLLTPLPRLQVIVAKSVAVMMFLLVAVALGGVFLQVSLLVAHAVTDAGIMDGKVVSTSLQLVDSGTALRLLFMAFIANLSVLGFFILFSLFFESPILMAFVSLIVLMSMETYVLMADFLIKLDASFGTLLPWCFTRHLSQVFDFSTIDGILEKSLWLSSPEVQNPLLASMGWALAFFFLAAVFFQRKQILH